MCVFNSSRIRHSIINCRDWDVDLEALLSFLCLVLERQRIWTRPSLGGDGNVLIRSLDGIESWRI